MRKILNQFGCFLSPLKVILLGWNDNTVGKMLALRAVGWV